MIDHPQTASRREIREFLRQADWFKLMMIGSIKPHKHPKRHLRVIFDHKNTNVNRGPNGDLIISSKVIPDRYVRPMHGVE